LAFHGQILTHPEHAAHICLLDTKPNKRTVTFDLVEKLGCRGSNAIFGAIVEKCISEIAVEI
jgi:hypothetical protein